MPFQDDQQPYTLEQAEEDIAILRGQVAFLSEILSQTYQLPNGPSAGVPTAGYQQYMDGPGYPQAISAADSTIYDYCSMSQYVSASAGQVVSLGTPAQVGNMAFTLAPTMTYDFDADIWYTPAGAVGQAEFLWTTLGAFTSFQAEFVESEVAAAIGTSAAVSLKNGEVSNSRIFVFSGAVMGTNTRRVQISGSLLTAGVANSIALAAQCSIAGDDFTILQGSRMTIRPRVAGAGL